MGPGEVGQKRPKSTFVHDITHKNFKSKTSHF